MTARASVLPAALLRAGLLAVVMAVVAGIFGMHVMTADHSSHAAHAGAAVGVGHTGVEHPDAGHAAILADAVGAAGVSFTAESCSAGCPDVREGGASCTPLAKTGSLAAAPPPANPTALLAPASDAHGTTGYSFVMPSPTPCELSISRT